MMKFFKMMFFNTAMLGTLIAASANSWIGMWIGLEINLLSIIPLMTKPNDLSSTESAMKYFIAQSAASMIFLVGLISLTNSSPQTLTFANSEIMINTSMILKMGAAPLHSWFPEVMEGLDWWLAFMMMTWQKIAPMVIFMHNHPAQWMSLMVAILCSMVGGILGLNQISIRKIMAYSSITHVGWMISSMMYLKSLWTMYFIVYSLMALVVTVQFNEMKIFFISQLTTAFHNKIVSWIFSLNFLSMGGLPPFLGFTPKWLTMLGLIDMKMFGMAAILVLSTLLTLFFYTRLIFHSLMMNKEEPVKPKSRIKYYSAIIMSIPLITLPLSLIPLNL
nr:NADH dehydrogenase subunit 2 [Sagra femorata]